MKQPKQFEVGVGQKAICKHCGGEIESVLFHNSNTVGWVHLASYEKLHTAEPLESQEEIADASTEPSK